MSDDRRSAIEHLRDRIQTNDDIAEEDSDLLLQFSKRLDLLAQTYSGHRHEKLLRHGTIIAEQLDGGLLAKSLRDRDASETIVAWINANYDNVETNRDYRTALRMIGKRIAEVEEEIEVDDNGIPRSLSWVPTGTPSTYDPTPDPREMLSWEEDVQSMLDETYNARDTAMIALQFDAGLRGGEFKDLRVGDVRDHDHGLQVTVEGKQGRRTVLLIPSVPYVNRWLDEHPDRSDPDNPLWSRLHHRDAISDQMIYKAFREAAKRAEVTKPVTLTNFRKSSAAFLASRNLNQAHIEDHHGWVRGSRVASRYISIFAEDSERELAKLHGIDVSEEEPDPIAPLVCPRCGKETPRDEPVCVWCGQAMQPEAASELETLDTDFMERLANLDGNEARDLLDIESVRSHPEVVNALLRALN